MGHTPDVTVRIERADTPPSVRTVRTVLNVAHRGASGVAPEHTIPAYDAALERGAVYIEQDLQMTADDVLVVLHDPTLDRTSRSAAGSCRGRVASKTLAQVKRCDVGSWFNEAFPARSDPAFVGLQVPTLEEVFERYRDRANFYIETKNPGLYPHMEEELVRLLDHYGLTRAAEVERKVLIQSFFPANLLKVHVLNPRLPLVQLYPSIGSERIRASLDRVASYAAAIGPPLRDVDEDLIEAAHARCLQVHPYTADGRRDLKKLLALGVDGIFTNFPGRLERILHSRGQSSLDAAAASAREARACRAASLLRTA